MATTSFPQNSPRLRDNGDTLGGWLSRAFVLNWYTVAYIVIFAVAILTRFPGLGDRVMTHDESLHTYYSHLLYRNGDFQHTPLMHGPILFHATALMYALFGVNDFTARLYPAILGVLMVMMPLLFSRWLGRTGALLTSVGILISPLLLYHHRYIREDTPSIFFTIIMAYCTLMYIDGPLHLRRKARWLYIFAAAMLGSLGSKEVAFMYILIFGLFLTLFFAARFIQRWRKVPTRTLFYYLTLPVLLGGVLALLMYCVIAITLSTSPTLEGRIDFLLQQIGNLGGASFEFTTFSLWSLTLVFLLIILVIGTAVWAFRRAAARLRWGEIIIIIALSLVVCGGLIVVEEVAKLPSRAEELVNDPDNDTVDIVAETNVPLIGVWVLSAGLVGVAVAARQFRWWRTLHRFPEFDIMILMGTLILPWGTAVFTSMTGADPTDYSQEGLIRSALVVVPLMLVSIAFGLSWNWKRWLISAAVFHILYVFFFTTMFTNPMGLATGMVGSLGYWLEQQGVERGSQPQYYYQLIVAPMYEFMFLIGSFLAMVAGLIGFWRFRARILESRMTANDNLLTPTTYVREDGEVITVDPPPASITPPLWGENRLRRLPFTLFMGWWAIFIFIALTLAGEKMPWLVTHITLPLIFLTGWYFGGVFERVNWAAFRERGWLYLLLLPLAGVALFQVVSPFLINQSPLNGDLSLEALQQRNQWIALLAVFLIVAGLIVWVRRQTRGRHLSSMLGVATFIGLSALTFRAAFAFSFINYDYATEYGVYAHGAPGIKLMMEQIDDLSRRTAGELSMRFAWGGNAWPVSWYFRDMTNATFFGDNPNPDAVRDAAAVYVSNDLRARVEPLLEDNYYHFQYKRMWWPDQSYFGLSAQRVANAWDFSPTNAEGGPNTQPGQIRQGIWDIWWARDFDRYGEAVGTDYSLPEWPVAEDLHFYVRKDIAAQVWNMGVGEGTVFNPLAEQVVNLCTENWQALNADLLFPSPTTPFNHALDLAVSPETGRVYVADEFNNRIVVYEQDGTYGGFIDGTLGGQAFQRPNSVAIMPDGNLAIADTWNYRIAIYTPNGEFVRSWGQPLTQGSGAPTEPTDGVWGPRDIAVDGDGNVYISDTGNKRVRMYNQFGEWLRDIGSGGSELGQLDEPSGLEVGPNNQLYVADTWNQRISLFALDGVPATTFPVRGWYEDLGNRPYLAIDDARNLVYITDPDAGRILVYDGAGNCVGSFGQASDTVSALNQFQTVGGITVDQNGYVYVSDAGANRVLRFAPWPVVPAADSNAVLEALPQNIDPNMGAVESLLETTIETTAETTDEPVIDELETTPEEVPTAEVTETT